MGPNTLDTHRMLQVLNTIVFIVLATASVIWSNAYTVQASSPILSDNNGPLLKFGDRIQPRRKDVVSNIEAAPSIQHMEPVTPAPHRLEMSTEFFVIPPRSSSIGPDPSILVTAPKRPQNQTPNLSNKPSTTSNVQVTQIPRVRGALRSEAWAVPLLVTAALGMIMIAAFEVFVLCKAWRTAPSRRHLFLGQMLLLGLFCCSGLGALLAAVPTPLTCAAVRFGTGVSCALIFAALLVKCVFLISLNGGVYLPAPYQGLLLLFAVLIQVAVGTQWLVTTPPQVEVLPPLAPVSQGRIILSGTLMESTVSSATATPYTLCHTPFSDLLASLIYVVFLIIFVSVLAVKSRGIRDNYREASYIGLAIGCIIPIWLSWSVSGMAVADRHRDGCLGFGLVASACTVFIIMFAPKGRQLAAMGRDGLYCEDTARVTCPNTTDDAFSSISRTGSGYAPSFFHFKPLKYGLGLSNTDAIATTKPSHHDRMTLVAASPHPPSYSRMFPNHRTMFQHYVPEYHYTPHAQFCYYPRYPGLFMRPDDSNVYTSLEQTLSSNPNVYFQRGGAGVHPGMMY